MQSPVSIQLELSKNKLLRTYLPLANHDIFLQRSTQLCRCSFTLFFNSLRSNLSWRTTLLNPNDLIFILVLESRTKFSKIEIVYLLSVLECRIRFRETKATASVTPFSEVLQRLPILCYSLPPLNF